MRKAIPSGSVYRRSFKGRDGKKHKATTWTLKYYVKGEPIRESTGLQDRDGAIKLLRQRMAKFDRFSEYSDQISQVRVNQLLDLVVEDYQFHKRASTYDTKLRIDRHLRPAFGQGKAAEITSAAIRKYTADRATTAEPATVNKELAYLRRAFRLGMENEPPLATKVPAIKMLPVENARTGIVSHEQYRAVRDSLPSYARIALVISYHTGARKGEINKIRTETIDLKTRRIELRGRTTKNKKARFLPIYGDMEAELSMALSFADKACPLLVQADGKPVTDWEKSWKTACNSAGIVEKTLFHDLRRTALTNMMEAGFSEKEAMEISGHKTRHVFDRYHIVSERRLNQLGEKMGEFLRGKEQESKQDVTGTDGGHRLNVRTN